MGNYISEATEYLSSLLIDHYTNKGDNLAIKFLSQVSRIVEFREAAKLPMWDRAILSIFNDDLWSDFEIREDFGVLESVWEVGRFNMFGSIDEKSTQNLYIKACELLSERINANIKSIDEFDLSKW